MILPSFHIVLMRMILPLFYSRTSGPEPVSNSLIVAGKPAVALELEKERLQWSFAALIVVVTNSIYLMLHKK